jgi:signal recognition particle receptor subunit beta
VPTVNAVARELSAKLVYYGPGLSGKTTTLQQLHVGVRPESRGQLVSLATEGDRTLFFDFLPIQIELVHGLTLRLQLYTVPGQVFYDATRKLVLNGADGVVFVADSQPAAMDRNMESMFNLETNLSEMGIELEGFPHVIQYNKRDLPGALPVADLRRELNRLRVPEFETVASQGTGVLAPLREITRLVVKELRSRQPPRPRPMELSGGGSELSAQIAAAAEAPRGLRAPAPVTAPDEPLVDRARLVELSFARLFPGNGRVVAEVEEGIRERAFGPAVRHAAQGVADVLGALRGGDDVPSSRAALLGLDGREFLRLGRIAARPDAAVTEGDALFALYLLVAAKVKADRL